MRHVVRMRVCWVAWATNGKEDVYEYEPARRDVLQLGYKHVCRSSRLGMPTRWREAVCRDRVAMPRPSKPRSRTGAQRKVHTSVSRSSQRANSVNGPVSAGRKSTQRERLLAGMVTVANREGYAGVSVSQVIAHAGVSRPTFYEYFADKDDCFLTVQREIGLELRERVRRALAARPPAQAARAAVAALLDYARSRPARSSFLTNQTPAGGPRVLAQRDRTLTQLIGLVERVHARAAPEEPSADLPTRALLGSVLWLIAAAVRRGEEDLPGFDEDLGDWIERHNRPAREHRWRTLQPGPEPPPSPHVSELPVHPPPPIPPGKSRLSSQEIARNHRERILHATAQVAVRKGYTASTVADIAKAARLDRSAFYPHFRDKQQAFLAVYEQFVQHSLGISARAFFSAQDWPERIWQAILAATHFQARHPLVTQMLFVESYAVGAPAVQRIDDGRSAFTIFLQEGAQQAAKPSSQRLLEAISSAILEIGYARARTGDADQMARLAPHATYLCLTPFLGSHAASAFIDGKLR